MPQEFPRLLVATEFPPNIPGGGGAIMRQMLKDWPVEKLFWWSCQPDIHKQYGRHVSSHAVATIPRKLYPNRRTRNLKCWLMETFWMPWATRHLRATLASVRPEVVWGVPHGWSTPPLSRVLLSANIPCHISVYDYADCGPWVASFGLERCRWLVKQQDQLYTRATTRDCVSREMSNDLLARTGASGAINRTGLEPEDFAALETISPVSGNTIRIAYAGTLIVEQEFALLVSGLDKVRQKLTKTMSLEFFGDHSYRQRPWFNPAWMNEHGNLDKPGLAKALKECDWGFSPMHLTDEDPRYDHFSLPTKFVSYLAAGLPVITLGHPESTVVKMARQYQIGLCVTDGNPEKLGEELLGALSCANPRQKYQAEIQRCTLAEFDAGRMRAVLYDNLRTCARKSIQGGN
jgi:hypothetical protein